MSGSSKYDSSNRRKDEQTPEELWKKLQIGFRLESKKFPGNKIYGVVDVEPESSRELIEKCLLVVKGQTCTECNGQPTIELAGKSIIEFEGDAKVMFDGKTRTPANRGARVEIDSDTCIQYDGKNYVPADGKASFSANGKTKIKLDGKAAVTVDEKTKVKFDGKATVTVDGKVRVEIEEKTDDGNVGKARITIDGKTRVEIEENIDVGINRKAYVELDGKTCVEFGETYIPFDPLYRKIAASGLFMERTHREVYVIAIPSNPTWENYDSDRCPFSFTGKAFGVNPSLSFEWPSPPKATLVISWLHLGDNIADQYVMYLDGVDVQYIRRKQISDVFEVKINGFEGGQSHTFQLVAKRRNRKQTYESDLMKFTVPSKELVGNGIIAEHITVSSQACPANLPIFLDETESSNEPQSGSHKPADPPSKTKPQPEEGTCAGCKHQPHDKFPGFEHYFGDHTHVYPCSAKYTSTKGNRRPRSDNTTDDDDGVTASKGSTKS